MIAIASGDHRFQIHSYIILRDHVVLQMLVDDIGDVTITNDGATILKLLEVQHPAAKVCH